MVAYRHLSHGFEPVFNERSRILVLGSFPSELSRRNDFYYGNPNNRFWRVMAAVAGAPEPATIEEKRTLLLSHGVALWDVIAECDIKGSSDASIKNVVPTQVEFVLARANIERVVCNGAVAGRLYKRYLQWKTGIDACVLPSTSPANAAWSADRLIACWGDALGSLPTLPVPPASPECDAASTVARVGYATVSLSTHRSMQGNKGKDTKPELLVRRRLRDAGLVGYRLQWKVPGRPDIAWPGKRVCIFVNGCFWHRCPHCRPPMPKKNTDYWTAKFDRNVQRDAENLAALEAEGWRVHTIWECQLKRDVVDETFAMLLPQLSEELGKPLRL